MNDYTKIATPVIFPLGLDLSQYGSDQRSAPVMDSTILDQDFYSYFPQLLSIPESSSNDDIETDSQDNLDSSGFISTFNSPAVNSTEPSISSDASQSWSCSMCTYMNPGTFLQCEICSHLRNQANEESISGLQNDDSDDRSADSPFIPPEHLTNPFYYHLVAVVRHVGRSAFSGHYTCDSLHKDPNTKEYHWYRCDDSSVTQISQVETITIRLTCIRKRCCHNKVTPIFYFISGISSKRSEYFPKSFAHHLDYFKN